jgi:hypothetical protein
MNLKLVVAICVLAATPTFAQQPPPAGPKPTKADVQKVVQIISGDKAKVATYCDMAQLDDQITGAESKKDQKKVEELNKQQEAMGLKLGPEYVSLMTGLGQVDPASAEGKDLSSALDELDKLCKK